MTTLLEIDRLFTGYHGAPVVRDLSLHVDAGEIVALLGPNGAGKTSTLLTVSAVNPIIDGDIRFLGNSVRGHRPHRLALDGLARHQSNAPILPSISSAHETPCRAAVRRRAADARNRARTRCAAKAIDDR
jgi:branched-chain amino acid transport system ATP-binding protein